MTAKIARSKQRSSQESRQCRRFFRWRPRIAGARPGWLITTVGGSPKRGSQLPTSRNRRRYRAPARL
jgi:hypothetical protein